MFFCGFFHHVISQIYSKFPIFGEFLAVCNQHSRWQNRLIILRRGKIAVFGIVEDW